jgi:hypothetical protein
MQWLDENLENLYPKMSEGLEPKELNKFEELKNLVQRYPIQRMADEEVIKDHILRNRVPFCHYCNDTGEIFIGGFVGYKTCWHCDNHERNSHE